MYVNQSVLRSFWTSGVTVALVTTSELRHSRTGSYDLWTHTALAIWLVVDQHTLDRTRGRTITNNWKISMEGPSYVTVRLVVWITDRSYDQLLIPTTNRAFNQGAG